MQSFICRQNNNEETVKPEQKDLPDSNLKVSNWLQELTDKYSFTLSDSLISQHSISKNCSLQQLYYSNLNHRMKEYDDSELVSSEGDFKTESVGEIDFDDDSFYLNLLDFKLGSVKECKLLNRMIKMAPSENSLEVMPHELTVRIPKTLSSLSQTSLEYFESNETNDKTGCIPMDKIVLPKQMKWPVEFGCNRNFIRSLITPSDASTRCLKTNRSISQEEIAEKMRWSIRYDNLNYIKSQLCPKVLETVSC